MKLFKTLVLLILVAAGIGAYGAYKLEEEKSSYIKINDNSKIYY